MHARKALALLLAVAPLAAFAEGDSPWLPIPGSAALTASHTEQSGNKGWIGDQKLSISDITGGAATRYRRSTSALRLDYGISDAFALDVAVAYAAVKSGNADNSYGLADSVIGVSWRALDELERPALPTLTLRLAGIVKGDYDAGRFAGIGNGASGVEVDAIVGKQFTSKWSGSAELGFQHRDSHIPNAAFIDIGTRYRFAPKWSASLGYSAKRYSGELDIGGPGFTLARFPEVREERQIAKIGVGYAFAGNQGVALSVGTVTGGRNTVQDQAIANLAYTFAF
ncbi:transporter [Derxia lacustris]|uniref:transporter n=1 Tax=Derxia lacustris TaxID=764842 RepID=UPI000A177E08|nr:transporter [Derxia lacustris]